MWTAENRKRYDRSQLRYPSDLTDYEWQHIEAADPAGQARWAQARGERPGSDEWGHVCPEHGLPVAGDPEGLAAQKHGSSNDWILRSYDGTPERIHYQAYVKCREASGTWKPAPETTAIIAIVKA